MAEIRPGDWKMLKQTEIRKIVETDSNWKPYTDTPFFKVGKLTWGELVFYRYEDNTGGIDYTAPRGKDGNLPMKTEWATRKYYWRHTYDSMIFKSSKTDIISMIYNAQKVQR